MIEYLLLWLPLTLWTGFNVQMAQYFVWGVALMYLGASIINALFVLAGDPKRNAPKYKAFQIVSDVGATIVMFAAHEVGLAAIYLIASVMRYVFTWIGFRNAHKGLNIDSVKFNK